MLSTLWCFFCLFFILLQEEIQEFKDQFIYKHIIDTEVYENMYPFVDACTFRTVDQFSLILGEPGAVIWDGTKKSREKSGAAKPILYVISSSSSRSD